MWGLTYLPLLCLDTEKSLQKTASLCSSLDACACGVPITTVSEDLGEPQGCWAQTKPREGCTPSWHLPGISHRPKPPGFCAQRCTGRCCSQSHLHTLPPGERFQVLCREKTQAQRHNAVDESNAGTIRSVFSRNYMAKDILILENPAPGPWFDPMTLKHGFLGGQFASSSTLLRNFFIDLLRHQANCIWCQKTLKSFQQQKDILKARQKWLLFNLLFQRTSAPP